MVERAVIRRTAVLAAALMCATAIVTAQTAEERNVSVWMPSVAMAPAVVQLSVRVVPSKENRLLRVTLDSGAYFRSSDLPLEGAEAPALHSVRWPGVPSGDYVVIVELFRSNGKRHIAHTSRLDVVGVRH